MPSAQLGSAARRRVEVLSSQCQRATRRASSCQRLLRRGRRAAPRAAIVELGVVALAERQVAAAKNASQRVEQLQLVRDRQLDVDALDAVGVLAHASQRDHDVFVDLEGVGVLGDRRGARAVEPEFLARFAD